MSSTDLPIPDELFLEITKDLDITSIMRCRQVCRLLCSVIDGSAYVGYRVELALAGMEDGPPGEFNLEERLQKLRSLQRALWQELCPTSALQIIPRSGPLTLYEPPLASWLRGGTWAYIGEDRRSVWLFTPSSSIRGTPGCIRSIPDLGFNLVNLLCDPVQNLVALIQSEPHEQLGMKIHLRTMDGTTHPSASTSFLQLKTVPSVAQPEGFDVHGDFLAIGYDFFMSIHQVPNNDWNAAAIWNWKTGALVLGLYGCESVSCAFLSDRYILLTIVVRAEDDGITETHLAVLDYRQGSSGYVHYRDATYVCRFRYPQCMAEVSTWEFVIARPVIRHDGLNDTNLAAPFIHSQKDTIIHIVFLVNRKALLHERMPRVSHLIPLSVLLRYIDDAGDRSPWYDWDEWAPDTYLKCYRDRVNRTVFGSRLIEYDDTVRPKALRVHNFNQYYIKHRLSRSADNEDAERFAEGVTTTNSDDFTNIFMDRVETTLLCHTEELEMPWLDEFGSIERMYICDDAILFALDDEDFRAVSATF
ncbi:hypothetical protein OBBRIDRAFT_885872 [Obba rivulosa]|uniref:F-box domain-containing protein n=1 Tax=Obba rivulosa TaxID=1052685 RepID=A0A8E2DP46_9APHY|nr:hypothetical protein OBBRIDRAFT_885872 [Obba rivulosa]